MKNNLMFAFLACVVTANCFGADAAAVPVLSRYIALGVISVPNFTEEANYVALRARVASLMNYPNTRAATDEVANIKRAAAELDIKKQRAIAVSLKQRNRRPLPNTGRMLSFE
jgi:hypothetical protein